MIVSCKGLWESCIDSRRGFWCHAAMPRRLRGTAGGMVYDVLNRRGSGGDAPQSRV